MKKYLKIGLALIVVVALGVTGAKKIQTARAADAALAKAKIYPIVVRTMLPSLVDAKLSLPYLADVDNDKDVLLSSRISARIISIKNSGTPVKKGEIIARLDTTSIQSTLKSIQNQITSENIALKNLRATHKRTLELLNVQGASIEESQKEATMIAATEAKLAGLKQQEIESKNNLSYALITSPVDGVIAKSMGSDGAMSMPGSPLAKISSKNGFYLMLRIPTNINIKEVSFNGEDFPVIALGSTFHGLAEYKVYTGDSTLTSGDRAEVDVIIYNNKGFLLPFDALLNREGKSYVLVVDANKAEPKEVHILESAEQGVVVSESFSGEKIVVAKPDILLKLSSGYALEVRE
ncbi:efflux transporter periplasmic adaptor subunit [Sulfurimonas sp.]|jgi:multidrug efflux pump subunit AcrA (membrane-fusion protein)|uniref:efflux RND transporter periplasmic adaptor subunit n=1 Tax=Sulfurimonas sp. TaxID=2022749 RepID=UPI0025F8B4F6|nr:efflux transporter periplasmic adaptor subunit [Sulfurimonas sp.]MCK9473754.1 efflux transporter periplasmic adaptor subunit [Sulfurimonas sp.]MDD3505087.1 efflux transporter periplasmic adaptor subunit [Sulfurimonas sp.]